MSEVDKMLKELPSAIKQKMDEIFEKVNARELPPSALNDYIGSLSEETQQKIATAVAKDKKSEDEQLKARIEGLPPIIKVQAKVQSVQYETPIMGAVSLWSTLNQGRPMPTSQVYRVGEMTNTNRILLMVALSSLQKQGLLEEIDTPCGEVGCMAPHPCLQITDKGWEYVKEKKLGNPLRKKPDFLKKDLSEEKPDLKKDVEDLGNDFLRDFLGE